VGAVFWASKNPVASLISALATAWFALIRRFAQIEADRKRRITESYNTRLSAERFVSRCGKMVGSSAPSGARR
jgi:hypothetical protein